MFRQPLEENQLALNAGRQEYEDQDQELVVNIDQGYQPALGGEVEVENDPQIDTQKYNVNRYGRLDLQVVHESGDDQEENDSWHQESLKRNQSPRMSMNLLDGSLLQAKFKNSPKNLTHKEPDIE